MQKPYKFGKNKGGGVVFIKVLLYICDLFSLCSILFTLWFTYENDRRAIQQLYLENSLIPRGFFRPTVTLSPTPNSCCLNLATSFVCSPLGTNSKELSLHWVIVS